ncbi:MAG: Panacea domain-containing protein [Propionibacterium acidifaciens]|uniref:Panacea domain-containing protein n=1 Tax=Propionibacterium acidifaciens TaxID=556499 RepID=UPI003608ADF5
MMTHPEAAVDRALAAAQVINARRRVYGETQAQKLAYYAQAWSLVWDGRPLFPNRIEAWQMGPVIASLRHGLPAIGQTPPVGVFADSEMATLNAVTDYYGAMGGGELAELTHREEPWLEAWGDRSQNEKGNDPISLDTMRRFYTRMALRGEGPRRPPMPTATAPDEEIARIAADTSRRWAKTLAILGS